MSIERLSAESAARSYVQQSQLTRANAASAAKDTDKAVSTGADRADSVVLSANAKTLATARDAVKDSDGDLRHARVSDIQQRLTDGTYSVDARVLARKMLNPTQS